MLWSTLSATQWVSETLSIIPPSLSLLLIAVLKRVTSDGLMDNPNLRSSLVKHFDAYLWSSSFPNPNSNVVMYALWSSWPLEDGFSTSEEAKEWDYPVFMLFKIIFRLIFLYIKFFSFCFWFNQRSNRFHYHLAFTCIIFYLLYWFLNDELRCIFGIYPLGMLSV